MLRLTNTITLAIGLLARNARAFWRMECDGMVGLARLDPLVNNGTPSAHVHALFGSDGLSLTSSNDDLRAGSCTSCAVTQDKSGYWQPALYFEDSDTGGIEYVPIKGDTGVGNAGILAYYKLLTNNGNDESGLTAFPPNFKMIAGTAKRRTYDERLGDYRLADDPKTLWASLGQVQEDLLRQRAIGFNCLNYQASKHEPTLFRHFLPDKEFLDGCVDGLRTEIVFPACWNGEDLDSPDHQSHVAYPSLVEDGHCPDGFPIRFPTLIYEAIWDTARFANQNGRFVLSNGDPTGFGMHADFMNGWEGDTLQRALNKCHNKSGNIRDCDIFNIQEKSDWESCKLELPDFLNAEDVKGPSRMLPGSVPIVELGEDFDAVVLAASQPATPKATSSESDKEPQETKEVEQPVEVEAEPEKSYEPESIEEPTRYTVAASPSEPTAEPVQPEPSTVAPASPPPASEAEVEVSEPATTEPAVVEDAEGQDVSYRVISTEYQTVGNVVRKIIWEEAWVYVTEDVTSTVTVDAVPRARRARRGHAHNHMDGHNHY